MSDLPVLDSEARYRAITELGTTFLVEAGAGTGKTSVLLQRLLTLVRTGKGQLPRVVAITFTEKAAAELRVRLRAAIDAALAGPLPDDERQHLRTARTQLAHAQISTVHAFCATLLRERPVEARIDPDFTILDESRANLLRSEAWQEWLTQEMERSPHVLKQAFRADLTLEHLETLRDFLIEHRDCLHLLPTPLAFSLPEYRTTLTDSVAHLSFLSSACVNPTDRALTAIRSLRELLPANENDALWERFFLRDLALSTTAGARTNWQPATALDEIRNGLRHTAEVHTQARSTLLHNITVALAHWLAGFLHAYDKKKQEQNSLDFTDLLLRTRDLLAYHLEVRRYFQQKFDFLLVDESQDTDPLQAEIVFFLAERLPQATDWTTAALRPGKLFLVGDPQQSIYRFRRADLDVYLQVRRAVARQGEILALSSNFRSRAPVLTWINETFTRAFAATETDQPSYRSLTAVRSEETGSEVILLPVPEDLVPTQANREDHRQAEAKTIAAFLKQSVEHPHVAIWGNRQVRYCDVAILFRTYQAMERYETACKSSGVPYRIIGGRRYTSRQEIVEIRTLLRTIENPSDTTALVATLRSSIFGFSDEDLAHFVAAGGRFHYLSPHIPASLPGAEDFTAAFTLLNDFHSRRTQLHPATLLYDIYTRTHLLPFFALRPQGTQRVANLLKLIDIAHAFAAQGFSTLDAFTRFLDRQDGAVLEEESAIIENQEDAVHLLTIHKAKGLEFPVVILADAVGSHGHQSRRTGILERLNRRLELSVGPRSLTCTTQGWQKAEAQEQEKDAAEEQRLRYVAAARVRDHLIIPITSQGKGGGNITHWALGEGQEWLLDSSSLSPAERGKVFVYQMRTQEINQIAQEPQPAFRFSQVKLDLTTHDTYQKWQADRQIMLMTGKQRKTASFPEKGLLHKHAPQQRTMPFSSYGLTRPHPGRAIRHTLMTARREQQETGRLGRNIPPSTVLARAQVATTCLFDTPFILRHKHRLVEGVIDLAFLEQEAWVLVKVTVDSVSAPEQEAQAQNHQSQLLLAALALERLTGRQVKDLVLFFTHSQHEMTVEWGEHERALAESLLETTLSLVEEY